MRVLLDAGHVVVGAGGGGIPVVRDADGTLRGVEAVIDKDLAAALLARTLGADVLVIATDVDHAVVGCGTPRQRPLDRVDARRDARRTPREGQFACGSMGPKVEAAAGSSSRGGAERDHVLAHIVDAVDGTAAGTDRRARPIIANPREDPTATCPTPSRSARSRCTPCPTPAGSATLIDEGVFEADRVIAVIGKTEGNGGVNDYTRIIADRAFREVLVDEGRRRPTRSSRCRSSGPAAPTA